jgi:ubiquinone biosynthesis protein
VPIAADGRVALLNLGIVGHVNPELEGQLLRILLAVGKANGEEAAKIVERISQNNRRFRRGGISKKGLLVGIGTKQ